MATPSESLKDCLEDYISFPPFKDLPGKNQDHEIYYCPTGRRTKEMYKHWCFLGEITYNELSQMSLLHNRVIVRDKIGQGITIFFYPESGWFDFKTLQVGHTVAVLYAECCRLIEGQIGLRIEDLDSIRVIKCSFKELLEVSRLYSKGCCICWNCEKITNYEEDFKTCSACSVASYCGKECQVKDWNERHKRICKEMKKFLKLTEVCKKATMGKYLTWD